MNRLAGTTSKKFRFEAGAQHKAQANDATEVYLRYIEEAAARQRSDVAGSEADNDKENARRGRVADSFLTCASQVGRIRPLPFYSHGTVTAPKSSHGRNYFRRQITNPAGKTILAAVEYKVNG